jgi:hypothetical protein
MVQIVGSLGGDRTNIHRNAGLTPSGREHLVRQGPVRLVRIELERPIADDLQRHPADLRRSPTSKSARSRIGMANLFGSPPRNSSFEITQLSDDLTDLDNTEFIRSRRVMLANRHRYMIVSELLITL